MRRLQSISLHLFWMIATMLSCTPSPQPEHVDVVDPEPAPIEEDSVIVSKGAYKHVIIVGVDGAGACFSHAITPNTFNIFSEGAFSYQTKASYPTISAQNWGSMLHGVLPEFHGLTNEIAANNNYDPKSPYPSIFRVVREAMPEAKLVSICNWHSINIGIIEQGLGLIEGYGNDPQVTDQVIDAINAETTPTLLFVHFDSVDGAGHGHGYGLEDHLNQLNIVDGYVGSIYDAMVARGIADETLFIVATDHGGTPNGSHGGNTYAERYVFLGVKGKTTTVGKQMIDPEVRDVAAIVAYALGIDPPSTWSGIVPTGVFEGVSATERVETEMPVSENRNHNTVPTPDISEIKSLLEGHRVLAYLPFDGDATDLLGGRKTVENGKLYYYDAWFGQGVALDDGYITLENTQVGTESFSIAFWMKAGQTSGDPSIISNKDWVAGGNNGFVLSLRSNDIKFNVGDRSVGNRMDGAVSLPVDYSKGWMHVACVVNRRDNMVRIFYDFEEKAHFEIPESLRSQSFDSMNLNIGQDGTGNYTHHLPAQLDEMIITSDVLTAGEIDKLGQYYKRNN